MKIPFTLNKTIIIIGLCCCFIKTFSQETSKKQNTNFKVENDSLKSCITKSFNQRKWNTFHNCRLKHLSLSLKNNDSTSLAKTLEFSGFYFQFYGERSDSAYYYYKKSALLYKSLKDSAGAARVLLNKAILRKNIHDYQGSLTKSYEALTYSMKKKKNLKRIASIYNNLGIVYSELKDTVDAIKYYTKALEIREKLIKKPKLKLQSLNNLAKAYKDYKDYKLAINYLYPIVKDSMVKSKFPQTYAMALDNYGHALFLDKQYQKSFTAMSEALTLRETISHKDGIVISSVHLAEYFAFKKEISTAISYAERAKKLSKQILNYRDYLASLNLLANFYSGEKAQKLYNTYNHIKDSLHHADRRHSDRLNQFEFELDEKEKELFEKEEELNINRIIFIVIGILTFILGLFFCIKFYNHRQLKKAFKKGFEAYLTKKYELTFQNITFWEFWISGLDQEQLSEKLFISIDAVKSRRKSLKSRIHRIHKIEGSFTQAKAIRLYNDELEKFRNHL